MAGEFCTHRIQFCTEFNPCAAGSTCNDKITDYTCSCPPGLSGKNCTDDVDNCAGNLCQVRAPSFSAFVAIKLYRPIRAIAGLYDVRYRVTVALGEMDVVRSK